MRPAWSWAWVFVLLSGPAAQVDWRQAMPPRSPTERAAHRLAYDSVRDRIVMYGGVGALSNLKYETWTWDGAAWTQIPTANAPDGLVMPGIAYDPSRDRVVVYGGHQWTNAASPNTWEFDGVDWTLQSPAHVPPTRGRPVLAYHAGIQRVVLFGGWLHDDTWLWDGTDWTELKLAVRPVAREGHGMAYDEARDRIVLFGGRDNGATPLDDTWEFDGTRWTRVFPATSPPARAFHQMAYDADRQRVVVYGSYLDYDRVWEYDGVDWAWRPVTNRFSLVTYDMSYHAGTRRLVSFGYHNRTYLPETWELVTLNPATVDRYAPGCTTANAIALDRAPHEWPWLGDVYEQTVTASPSATAAFLLVGTSNTAWGGAALPLPLGGLGVPGCDLLAAGEWIAPYPVQGGLAAVAIAIPSDAALLGARFFEQALVIDPGLRGGLGLSDGFAVTVGSR